jgi:uncharacterized protein YbbC (DUF1343 family)
LANYIKLKKFYSLYRDSSIGLLTNQSAFGGKLGLKYHFEVFQELLNVKYLFMPEHGLFAELQDQVPGDSLKYNYKNVEVVNLYGQSENTLFIDEKYLNTLDMVLIDIRDVGARYYTFLTTAYYLLRSIDSYHKKSLKKIEVCVVDSSNPIGRKIEGSPLEPTFESFVGVPTVPHRHGLTSAELLDYYCKEFHFSIKLNVISIGEVYYKNDTSENWIPPSPNIPTIDTCRVYVGQCLLEGTNLSEGRGTTKPFEIFGAPFIDIQDKILISQINYLKDDTFVLRPLYFSPTFHKHSNKICGGFQLMVVNPKKFSSLLFSLGFIKIIKDYYEEFEYLKGPYEFRSDRPAIELLVGDSFLLDFLDSKRGFKEVKEYLKYRENEWRMKIKSI